MSPSVQTDIKLKETAKAELLRKTKTVMYIFYQTNFNSTETYLTNLRILFSSNFSSDFSLSAMPPFCIAEPWHRESHLANRVARFRSRDYNFQSKRWTISNPDIGQYSFTDVVSAMFPNVRTILENFHTKIFLKNIVEKQIWVVVYIVLLRNGSLSIHKI